MITIKQEIADIRIEDVGNIILNQSNFNHESNSMVNNEVVLNPASIPQLIMSLVESDEELIEIADWMKVKDCTHIEHMEFGMPEPICVKCGVGIECIKELEAKFGGKG